MTTPTEQSFDAKKLEEMNAKAIENQFFTPDHVYLDISLFKDLPLGVMYSDFVRRGDAEGFAKAQAAVMGMLSEYESRTFNSVEKFLGPLGYGDAVYDAAIADVRLHDSIFLLAPVGNYFNTLIKHTMRNQNHSRPANKFTKRRVDTKRKDLYVKEAIDVTYHINTYPLTLSPHILSKMAVEIGEGFGVNVRFLNKDPSLFDQSDWDNWMEKIECFYLESLDRFNGSAFTRDKQTDVQFLGCYIFARMRFERDKMHLVDPSDYDNQVYLVTAQQGFLCEFQWLTDVDVRLSAPPKRVEVLDLNEDLPS
jgi:hypothetical protein